MKLFEAPEIQVKTFEAEDIITVSDESDDATPWG